MVTAQNWLNGTVTGTDETRYHVRGHARFTADQSGFLDLYQNVDLVARGRS